MLEEEGAGILREPCGIFEYKKPKKTIIHVIEKANKKLDEYGDELTLKSINKIFSSQIYFELVSCWSKISFIYFSTSSLE